MSTATRIATPYAKSLLDLARERSAIDEVTQNIEHFLVSIKNEDLRNLLASPIVSAGKKQKVFQALFGNYNEIMRRFIHLVTDKRRESALPEIAREFMRLFREERNITQVTISSAAPLTDAAVASIKQKLVQKGLATENIELERKIDPALVGGFVIEVGDLLYDASVKNQLNTLRKEFSGNLYVNNIR